jgi:type 1 fimbriae regulatory protein FimB
MITATETVDPRPKNFLNAGEVSSFLNAAKTGRHGVRDYAMCLLAFRHGLRVSELIGTNAADVDLSAGRIFVRRSKGSLSTSQPMEPDEIRAVKAWLRIRELRVSRLLFFSERGPMTRQAFNYLCAEIGRRARLPVKVHPHMLRHSCGFALANKGIDTRLIQDYLGHKDMRWTALYTRTAAVRFEGLWS